MRYILRPIEIKTFTTALLGAENVVKVHASIMMPSVHHLAQTLYVKIMMRICLGELVSSLHSAELITKRLNQS